MNPQTPMPPRPTFSTTVIRKVKRPNSKGWGRWPAYVMNEDIHGVWLFSPKGTLYRGESGTTSVELEVGQGTGVSGVPVMHLIPPANWWVAAWQVGGRGAVISIDISTPAMLIDGEWCYTDLELDACLVSDKTVEILDEDEFAAACDSGLISPREALQASAAIQDIVQCLRKRIEPFGQIGWQGLEAAGALDLPPITMLKPASRP